MTDPMPLARARSTLSRLLAAFAWALVSTSAAQAGNDGAAPAETGVDETVQPGDDFFAYANGEWLKAAEIPAGRSRWSARDDIAALTRKRVAGLLVDAATAPAGSRARKVADFHASLLDEKAIEARGIAGLKPLLDRIDRVHDKASLTRLLGRGLCADVDPLNRGLFDSAHVLGLAVQASTHGEPTNTAFLLQGGLGLPGRAPYIGAEPGMQALRDAYQGYIGRMLTLAGFDHGARRAEAVMVLETALARSHASSEASSEDRNADHVWTRADFARRAPGLDWTAFFAAAGLGKERDLVAWQPDAVTGLAALVASAPLAAWKDYLRFHVVHRHADVLPRAFSDQAAALRAAASDDRTADDSRARRALDATQAAMGDSLGRMYVERYFPPAHRARAQAIVADVVAALDRRIDAAAWMSPATRAMAHAKLKSLYVGIGYPEPWADDDDLVVDRADAWGNVERVSARNDRRALARLGRRVDRTAWAVAPQSGGAVLLFHQNALDFSAALLQPPKFDPAAADAASYGAIGAVVGHEISHFVDTLGADYEADGRMRRWWTPDDLVRYGAASSALADQFASYRPFADLSVDGHRTLPENVADLGGLAAAFDAHRAALARQAAGSVDVRRQDRRFFIAFARAWRSTSRNEALRAQIATDSHAPDRYRVATVRNLDAWYEAFDVQPGQQLYLAPGARVRIW